MQSRIVVENHIICYIIKKRNEVILMMEYRPWSSDVLNPIIQESNKKLPILDIQLGGACNLGCPSLIAPTNPILVLSLVLSISF